MTIVCGDSHTSTHGAMGSLAFGIGTTEVAHALATQCVLQRKARTLSVECTGGLSAGVHAKDLILAIIQGLGVDGGVGHVIEYRGEAVRSLSMDQRMTLCNMAIEAGARTGMVAPDETTFRYLHGRERSPQGAEWEAARRRWESIVGDPDARFDKSFSIDASLVEPMITWGTTPAMAMPIGGRIPEADIPGAGRALDYMGFSAGMGLEGLPIDQVFIGSCTNSRLSDLQDAAEILRGRTIHPNIACLVVPGSATVKRQAERRGLDRVFIDAGCEWREPGCSMCLGMNGDIARRGAYVVSTSNRNFEGRQGPGTRTMLASPSTAAACAVRGCITDPRTFIHEPVFIK
jgi:3-isopropylmalate/(R)-2-methylmalate dehydratase large subunit